MAEKKKKPEAPEAETPSAIANAEIGEPPENASDEERAAYAERWNAAKRRAQRGF